MNIVIILGIFFGLLSLGSFVKALFEKCKNPRRIRRG
jgi:hypothetical protein